MPFNRMPSGWLYDGNPDYKGTTVAERRAIQNQINLIQEQERANKLQQERIEQDKLNAQTIASATIIAEHSRYEHELELQQNLIQLEEHNRFIQLCDNLNVDYDEIKLFEKIITQPDEQNYNNLLLLKQQKINLVKDKEKEIEKIEWKYFFEAEDWNENYKYEERQIETAPIQDKYNILIANIDKKINELGNTIAEQILNKLNAFDAFRQSNYNYDMELLFKKLKIQISNIEYCQNDKGTIKDYINYMRGVIKAG